MTEFDHATPPTFAPTHERTSPSSIEDFDLTPQGLADSPAQQQDPESIVHTGNS